MEMEGVVDDGGIRTGTVWTATAHAVTAIIGSGVLALPWSVAQLGWVLGPIVMVFFGTVTYYTAILLCDCYRSPDPADGRRNHTYIGAIRSCLGERDVVICGIIQNVQLWGTMVGYTITAAMSIMAIKLSHCFHKKVEKASCDVSGTLYIIIFGAIEVVLSQFPNLEKVSLLSYIAAAMSFTYSFIGLYLCAMVFASHHEFRGTLFGERIGSRNLSASTKIWHSFQALGNMAFAFTFAMVLIEIQDTLKSPPPENKTMKRASTYGIGVTALFYILLGSVGYAAFGNDIPGNILTGFYEPIWLIDIANVAVLIHLIGAYQVFAQPIFGFYERWLAMRWPDSGFLHKVYTLRAPFTKQLSYKFTLCKLLFRTLFIIFTTIVAMMIPFFNAVVGLLGSLGFWPLTVYYPVSMYMAQAKIKRRQNKWVILQAMSLICLVVSIVATIGSIAEIVGRLKHAKLFKIEF